MQYHPSAPRRGLRLLSRSLAPVLLAASLAPAFAADKPEPPPSPPSEAELRTTITKSLGFLEKEGEHWMKTKDCNGCHHLPEMLWSFHDARQRGFDVDPKKYDEWLTWAEDRATDTKAGFEMVALMKLAVPERPSPELTKLIAADQQPDGSWKPAGQFADMQKRGQPDSKATSARLFLLALDRPESVAEADAARAKATELLAKKDSPTTTEALVFRILYARSIGKPEEADALREQILKQQRGDGGWSWFIGENMSDPLATGQALYVLQPSASDPKTAGAIARAQQWLVKTLRDDGSWPIDYTHISKLDRSAPAKEKSVANVTMIYTYYGTGWATIGLLQALPPTTKPAAGAE
jgi:hypothetical protein